MLGPIINILVGVLILAIGYQVWIKKRVSMLHSYHIKNITDIEGYAKWIGKCLFYLGVILIVLPLIEITNLVSPRYIALIIALSIVVDFGLMIKGQRKFTDHIA